jgi:hypothetical protein
LSTTASTEYIMFYTKDVFHHSIKAVVLLIVIKMVIGRVKNV